MPRRYWSSWHEAGNDLFVRNDEDILETNLRYHLERGVDLVIATEVRRPLLRRLLREHWPLGAVLAVGGLLRLSTDLAYSALVTPDSWTYVKIAFEGTPVSFDPDRPSGYPLILEPLSLWGGSLATVTFFQHFAGLATGVLVYLMLWRLDVPRWAATLAASVFLLDSYSVTLSEQAILAETLFTLLLTSSAYLAVSPRRRPWTLALSGVLLAAAATTRTMGLFAVPVFLLYALWVGARWRPRALAVAAVALPLLAYSGAQGLATGYFGLTQADGWFLYGRVASLITCDPNDVPRETRSLCAVSGEKGRTRGLREPADYVFSRRSPAVRRFGYMHEGGPDRRRHVNGLLRYWARGAIVGSPGGYIGGVADDFAQYLRPTTPVPDSFLLASPREPFFAGFNAFEPAGKQYIRRLHAMHLPWYSRDVVAPVLLRHYQGWLAVPGWLLTVLSLPAVLALWVAALARRPLRHTKESLLMLGSVLAILVGAVAFSDYQDRFVPSLLPLLLVGLVLVGDAGVHGLRSSRRGPEATV